MVSSKIKIIGMGMVTPVGHNASQSCASINANLARFDELDEFKITNCKGHNIPVTLAAVVGVTDGQRRFLRLYRMALRAVTEAIHTSGILDDDLLNSGIYLCLAEEGRPGLDNRAERILSKKISQALDIEDLTPRCKIFNFGHASAFFAIRAAIQDLSDGRFQGAIVCAVDTYLDRVTLDWLNEMHWLKTDENSDGFIPGEGAACVVLKQTDNDPNHDKSNQLTFGGVQTAIEENSIYEKTACKGDALIESISGTMKKLDAIGGKIDTVVCDLNGQRYRSLEWGVSIHRAFQGHPIPPNIVATATCIGNTGAASGLINICFGIKALQKKYIHSKEILVWGGSDDGQRGSLFIHKIR